MIDNGFKAQVGKTGEDAVSDYLQKNGYRIAQRNYRVRSGEIDIIAMKNGAVHFVEVKARSRSDYGTAAEAVDLYKQRKIIRAARMYMAAFGLMNTPVSFDVAQVAMFNGQAVKIEYIENAFYETSR